MPVFKMCPNPQCAIPHGNIICRDESQINCFSKHSAREVVDVLCEEGLITQNEKLPLQRGIEDSSLPERSTMPAVFHPSESRRNEPPLHSPKTPILHAGLDDKFIAELAGEASRTRH